MMMTMMMMIMPTMMMMVIMVVMVTNGDGELKIHSNMLVHECEPRAINWPSWPVNWTTTLGSTTGQRHWPALLPPLASNTGHHRWSTSLAGIFGQDPWQHVPNTLMMMTMMLIMLMMMIMTMKMMMIVMMMMITMVMVTVMVGQHHWPALLAPLASRTGHHPWSAPLAGIIGQDFSQHVPNTSMTARAAFWDQNAGPILDPDSGRKSGPRPWGFRRHTFRSLRARLYVCIYGCMYVCMYACMYACLCVFIYASMYLCWYACLCMHVYLYMCMHVCMNVGRVWWFVCF
jgi:hypothetical protein